MPRFRKERRLLVRFAPHLRDVRVARHRTEIRIDAERTDRLREPLEIFELQLLIRERDHLVLQPQRADRCNLFDSQRPAQVDAINGCTAGCRLRRCS